MRENVLSVILLIIFLFLSTLVSAAPLYSGTTTPNSTKPLTGEGIQLNVNISGNATHGVHAAWIATNKSRSWVNYSTTAGAIKSGQNSTSYTTYLLNLSIGTDCGTVSGWRVYFNTTDGAENVTPIAGVTIHPYINSTSGVVANISTSICSNTSDMLITFSSTSSGLLEFNLKNSTNGTTMPCSYRCINCTNITTYNQSTLCYAKIYVSSVGTTKGIRLTEIPFVSVEEPPNLPKAIGTLAILSIIVIVAYTVARKRAGYA